MRLKDSLVGIEEGKREKAYGQNKQTLSAREAGSSKNTTRGMSFDILDLRTMQPTAAIGEETEEKLMGSTLWGST